MFTFLPNFALKVTLFTLIIDNFLPLTYRFCLIDIVSSDCALKLYIIFVNQNGLEIKIGGFMVASWLLIFFSAVKHHNNSPTFKKFSATSLWSAFLVISWENHKSSLYTVYSHCLELGWLKFPVESNFYRIPELCCV